MSLDFLHTKTSRVYGAPNKGHSSGAGMGVPENTGRFCHHENNLVVMPTESTV